MFSNLLTGGYELMIRDIDESWYDKTFSVSGRWHRQAQGCLIITVRQIVWQSPEHKDPWEEGYYADWNQPFRPQHLFFDAYIEGEGS